VKQASKQASQPASQQASQRVSQPASQQASKQVLITVQALCLPAGRKISQNLFFAYPHLIHLYFGVNFGCPLACPLCDRI
jgi:hypothetical protein